MSAFNPTFPAPRVAPCAPEHKLLHGIQIQAVRSGCSRLLIAPADPAFVCSIWAPAFAGETGKGNAHG